MAKGKMALGNELEEILLWLLMSPTSPWAGDLLKGMSPGPEPCEGFCLDCLFSEKHVEIVVLWDPEPKEGQKKKKVLCVPLY